MGFFSTRKKTPKKIVEIKTGDEFMAAMSDVYSTPFGGVGQHIHYVVKDEKVIDNANHWEPWEIRGAISHVNNHPRSRMDVSSVVNHGKSPVVDSGKWNFETGEMEHPDTRVHPSRQEIELPEIRYLNFWSMFWTVMLFAWVPFQWWIEAKYGYKAAEWLLCYPLPFFFVMVGISYFAAWWKKEMK